MSVRARWKNGSPLHVVCLWKKGASLIFLGESHWGYHRKWLQRVLVDGWESTFLLDLSIASVDTLAMKSLEGVTWHHPNVFRVPNRQPWYTQLVTGYPMLVTLWTYISLTKARLTVPWREKLCLPGSHPLHPASISSCSGGFLWERKVINTVI